MELTETGKKGLRQLQRQYGVKKGEQVFYVALNKGDDVLETLIKTITKKEGEGSSLTKVQNCDIVLTEKEKKLIEELRKIPFGEVVVILHDGQPTRLERVKEKIQL